MMQAGGEGDKLVHNGNPFYVGMTVAEEGRTRQEKLSQDGLISDVRVYDSQGQFIGIYRYDNMKKRYQSQKIFLGGS